MDVVGIEMNFYFIDFMCMNTQFFLPNFSVFSPLFVPLYKITNHFLKRRAESYRNVVILYFFLHFKSLKWWIMTKFHRIIHRKIQFASKQIDFSKCQLRQKRQNNLTVCKYKQKIEQNIWKKGFLTIISIIRPINNIKFYLNKKKIR